MKYKWVALTVTTVGALMSSLDTTVVVIGLPTILNDLHATIVHGIWIITGYQLMLTVLLVLLGRLGDMGGEFLTFLHSINRACLILGVVILVAIIPSLRRGPRTTSHSGPVTVHG